MKKTYLWVVDPGSVKGCLVLYYASERRLNYMIIFTLHHYEHPAQGQPEHRCLIEESQVGTYLECRRRLIHGVRGNIQKVFVKIWKI